jgi:hypothetical protein
MSSQSELPPLNIEAVRRAREWLVDRDTDAEPVMRELLETYENLAARHAMLSAQVAEDREKQAKRQASPAHPNTMIEGGGQRD